jgi:putative hydrolase of the HAD superfamily
VITNGESGLQRDKLARSGLDRYFELVFISSEVGVAKPNELIFRAALDKLGVSPQEAVMVGDNIDRDVAGTHAMGLHPVWLDRDNAGKRPEVPHLRIETLADLPSVVGRLSAWT